MFIKSFHSNYLLLITYIVLTKHKFIRTRTLNIEMLPREWVMYFLFLQR